MPPIPTESPISVCGPPNPLADLNAVSKRMCRKGAILLAILFFLFNVPALPSLSQWRTDERFYTDAAVGMAQSGDYLTPVHPDGALRF
jgi:4-amino-4-deoxy-L-arabinose transferase-like glycosyltransferase